MWQLSFCAQNQNDKKAIKFDNKNCIPVQDRSFEISEGDKRIT